MDWFLYDNGLRHESVNIEIMGKTSKVTPILFMKLQKKICRNFMVRDFPKI